MRPEPSSPSRGSGDPSRQQDGLTRQPDDPLRPRDTAGGTHARLAAAAQRASQRECEAHAGVPSLAGRLAQVGVLGWTIVVPALAGLVAGRWLDRRLSSGVFFSAPLLMLGTALGFWSAWRWMHRQASVRSKP